MPSRNVTQCAQGHPPRFTSQRPGHARGAGLLLERSGTLRPRFYHRSVDGVRGVRTLRTVPSPRGLEPNGGRSEGSNLDPLRQVAGNVNCMVRDAQVVDAVVSGLSTLHYFVFRGTPNITEPTHRHKRSNALKLCTFFFLSLGRSWPSAAATAAPTNTMGTWQSQATHITQLTQNTADITLHRLFALRQCKLLLRAATPCGQGHTGLQDPPVALLSHPKRTNSGRC